MWDAGNVSCKVGILTHPIVQEDIESIFKVYSGEAIMRRKFNPNRRIRDNVDSEMRERLNQRVVYGGNPEHKRNPGDFGLSPPQRHGQIRHYVMLLVSFLGERPKDS